MSRTSQLIWVWGGVASIVSFAVGWVGLMQFIPLPAPSLTPDEIVEVFTSQQTGIRLGAVLLIIGTVLEIPWAAVVAMQVRSTESNKPINAYTQIGACAVGAAVVIVAMLCWVVAAFRPERSPEVTQALSDMGFIIAIMPFMIFVVWNVAMAMAILGDDRPEPAFPRWSAYFCIWCGFLYIPGGALAFFQEGPFAWNGALAFYLPAIAFFGWILVMTVLTLKSINRQERPLDDNASDVPDVATPARV